ncbi:MAG: protein-disulfide reductase DsbD family protein [Rickettsiales bacterium]
MRNMKQFIFALCSLAIAGAAAAQDIPASPIAKTELVLDAANFAPGKTAYAGVHFTMPEGWHIYWQNPGDSGVATTLNWTLPDGVSAGDIAWPAPERVEVSGLVNYAYSHEVTLAVPLTATKEGISGPISVKAVWLVCRDVCIPESATLTGALPGTKGAEAIASALKAVPQLASVEASFHVEGEKVILTVPATLAPDIGPNSKAQWFPIDDGVTSNAGAQQLSVGATDLSLSMVRGGLDVPPLWHGVLELTPKPGAPALYFNIEAKHAGNITPTTRASTEPALASNAPASKTLLTLLGLAFLGGLILNIMPCVLPILALKALAITKKAQVSRAAAAHQGLAYTAGVVLSFLLIAGIMLALKASGAAIGWGFQLQNMSFVLVLGIVMLLVAANLLGMFELPVLFGEKATGIDDSSLRGSFLTGGLAVLVATPCSAPFMATAIGATLALATLPALTVFASLGLGMASPFLLISVWPAARRVLPKPGAWMHRFKQILAIPMLATAAWLFWVAVGMHGGNDMAMPVKQEAYSATRLAELRAAGTPVFVDATAAWCLTCKVNERIALRPDATQQLFRDNNVILMVADWTNTDPAITEYLAGFGRNGVPLYVYYPPHGEPVVLPQILTPGTVRETVLNSVK